MLSIGRSLLLMGIFSLVAMASVPKIGDRVPQFSLPAADGKIVALKDYGGKRLVLIFYRGYW